MPIPFRSITLQPSPRTWPDSTLNNFPVVQVRPWDTSSSYLHRAVDLRAVEHECEVVEAAQGSLPGHVLFFFDQEESVVQRQRDGYHLSTGDKQEAPDQHPLNEATLWGP